MYVPFVLIMISILLDKTSCCRSFLTKSRHCYGNFIVHQLPNLVGQTSLGLPSSEKFSITISDKLQRTRFTAITKIASPLMPVNLLRSDIKLNPESWVSKKLDRIIVIASLHLILSVVIHIPFRSLVFMRSSLKRSLKICAEEACCKSRL
jgi:hypothetical protein